MSATDQVRVEALVKVPVDACFTYFTRDIDQWWRRGLAYRVSGRNRGVLHVEPWVGGRLFETIATRAGPKVVQTGAVTAWEPPTRLALDWRAVNFRPDEVTRVEVTFEPVAAGTRVTVVHRGWDAIRADHPARHGRPPGPFLGELGMWWGALLGSLRTWASDRAPG